MASSLNHPHIAHVYEVGEDREHLFIAMELVEGRTLASLIPAGGHAARDRCSGTAFRSPTRSPTRTSAE